VGESTVRRDIKQYKEGGLESLPPGEYPSEQRRMGRPISQTDVLVNLRRFKRELVIGLSLYTYRKETRVHAGFKKIKLVIFIILLFKTNFFCIEN
jgi:hypothetical protein